MKSKYAFILVISIALVASNLEHSKAQVKFGPMAGVNFSDMTGDTNSDGLLFGFHLGFLVNFGVTDYFMVEPQILYSTKGAAQDGYDLNLSYIEIPIWLRYQLSSGLNFNVGPYAGILVSAKEDDKDSKDAYKGLDYGLAGGLGYQFSSGLGLMASYSAGMADIGDKKPILNTSFNSKVNIIKFSLSYTIGGRRG